MPDILSFTHLAGETRTLEQLGEVTSRFVSPYGYSLVACGRLTGRVGQRKFDFNTWPQGLIDLYIKEGLLGFDPSPAWGLRSGVPIAWKDLQTLMPRGHPSHRAVAIAAEWSIFGGLVVPTRRADGTLGLVTFAGVDDPGTAELRAILWLVGTIATERADAIAGTTGPISLTPPQVTERERDCLERLVLGQTDKQIAASVGISEATARYHIDNVRRKLGAATRGQLGALAVALGYAQQDTQGR